VAAKAHGLGTAVNPMVCKGGSLPYKKRATVLIDYFIAKSFKIAGIMI